MVVSWKTLPQTAMHTEPTYKQKHTVCHQKKLKNATQMCSLGALVGTVTWGCLYKASCNLMAAELHVLLDVYYESKEEVWGGQGPTQPHWIDFYWAPSNILKSSWWCKVSIWQVAVIHGRPNASKRDWDLQWHDIHCWWAKVTGGVSIGSSSIRSIIALLLIGINIFLSITVR